MHFTAPKNFSKRKSHSTITNISHLQQNIVQNWVPKEIIDDILQHSPQIPAVSKKYFYTNQDERTLYLKKRRWIAGLGLTVRYLYTRVFPSQDLVEHMHVFNYSLAHYFTFGGYNNAEQNCPIALRENEETIIQSLANEANGSWIFHFGSEQHTLLLDFRDQNFDYFIGDQGHYSHRYCIRKTSESDVVVAKIMVKLSKWCFASLLIKLEYNHREKLQLMKVEQLTFILIQPDDKDASIIWRALRHLQYPFISNVDDDQLNVIHISGDDCFQHTDGLEWFLYHSEELEDEERKSRIFDILEQQILRNLIISLSQAPPQGSLGSVRSRHLQLVLKLMPENIGQLILSNSNWRTLNLLMQISGSYVQ
jgi:hypothetical protein